MKMDNHSGDVELKLGEIEKNQGRSIESRKHYYNALKIFRNGNNKIGEANSLNGIGDLESNLGRNDDARKAYEDALLIYKAEQYHQGQANALLGLAYLERKLGRNNEARKIYDNALTLYRLEEDRLGQANTLRGLGDLERKFGNNEEAREAFQNALQLYCSEKNRIGQAKVLSSIGHLESKLGRNNEARKAYDDALTLYRSEQNRLGEAHALRGLGHLELTLNRNHEARKAYDDALTLYRSEQNRLGQANVLRGLGDLERTLGNNGEARKAYSDALQHYDLIQNRLGQANALRGLGDLERALGRNEEARKAYDNALTLYQTEQTPFGKGNVYMGLGHLFRTTGDLASSQKNFKNAEIEYQLAGLNKKKEEAEYEFNKSSKKSIFINLIKYKNYILLSIIIFITLNISFIEIKNHYNIAENLHKEAEPKIKLDSIISTPRWYARPDAEVALIFVHGILSEPATRWRSKDGIFWPDLIRNDQRMGNVGVYLAQYHTDTNSGDYGVDDAARDVFADISNRQDSEGHAGPLKKSTIVFVAHSTGGLVVRQMLDTQREKFSGKTIGLLLLASPSRGSEWANRLKMLQELAGNRMLRQLQVGNDFLNDLDGRFADLVGTRSSSLKIYGMDAFENTSIIYDFPWPRTQVVRADQSSSYFGAARIVAGTDHFTIAKPTSEQHPSHKLLWEFLQKNELSGRPNNIHQDGESIK